jgi:hypothetical protein
MTCKNNKPRMVHSRLCEVAYPHTRIALSNDFQAPHLRDCTRDRNWVAPGDVRQTLSYETNMDLVSPDELDQLMEARAVFGTYCDLSRPRMSPKTPHFCVDAGRRTVDGRRLAWLWVFPDGQPKAVHKTDDALPSAVWTKAQVLQAWRDAGNETLSLWTRHVDTYSELAITFCLPAP